MSIGPWQIILILVIVLIIFGAGKLPRVAGDLAAGIKNFKKGMNDDDKAEAAESKDGKADVLESSVSNDGTAEKKDKAAQG